MTNINCSEVCIHENNGKCTLTHVSLSSNIIGYGTDCAYFSPRATYTITPPKKK